MREFSTCVLMVMVCAMHSGAPNRMCNAFSSMPFLEKRVETAGTRGMDLFTSRRSKAPRFFISSLQAQIANSDDENDQKFFGSRRIARFMSILGLNSSKIDDGSRFFGSRRLAALFNQSKDKPAAVNNNLIDKNPPIPGQAASFLDQVEDFNLRPNGNSQFSAGRISDRTDQAGQADQEIILLETKRPNLPKLSDAECSLLLRGERVQRQLRDGRMGTGMVVVDVQADPKTVFAILADIDRYRYNLAFPVLDIRRRRAAARKGPGAARPASFPVDPAPRGPPPRPRGR